MTTSPSSESESAVDPAGRRRRRRRTDDASASPPLPEAVVMGRRAGDVPAEKPRTGRWRALAPKAWGLSPTFRVFLFLGGIVGVMTFLLYNEALIQGFREQERERAALYAKLYGLAISEALPSEVSGDIFETIISNPKVSFPIIVTDHRGRINSWKGPGLPDPDDTSAQALAAVQQAMAEMDAVNEPVAAMWNTKASVRVYQEGANLVLVDPDGYAAAWSGPALPATQDTTAMARQQAEAMVASLQASASVPMVFHVSPDSVNYLVRSGADFAVSRAGRVIAWGGPAFAPFDEGASPDPAAKEFYDRIAASTAPIAFRVNNEKRIHFGNRQLWWISLAPFVTIGVLLLFVLIGWIGSRNIRRSEQRSIWVGMAKETAHQLGTPLSSLSGWLELMGSRIQDLVAAPPEERGQAATLVNDVVREMQRDMGRLTQIASRFSQIGSVPELKPGDVRDVIQDTVAYFKGRGPQFGPHDFVVELEDVPPVPLNAELMGWAFENLFKNAIDAMVQQAGCIRVTAHYDDERRCVRIFVEDNGRGIDTENLARVFQPGFSTKKRGWGLGLAFVRRIVEEYHGGTIHIPRSEPGAGTTFEISLPVPTPDVKEHQT